MPRRDAFTADLFKDYEPGPVVDRFPDQAVRAFSLDGRLCKALGLALDECGLSREEVAERMTERLGQTVSKATLYQYTGQGTGDRRIPATRLAALVAVTGDVRPLNVLFADLDLIVVPGKYEALLRRERARELKERLERDEQAADAEWRARR